MVLLNATQNITRRHAHRYGQPCPPPQKCRSPLIEGSEIGRKDYGEDAWWGKDEDSLSMRVDGDSAVWVYRRKGRCRPGLERNSGRHGRRERPGPDRPGAICSDCATRCL